MLTLKQYIVYFADRTKGFLEIMDAASLGKEQWLKKFMQNWGPCKTVIPITYTEGTYICMYGGNVNALTFLNCVTDKLCPNFLPCNGRNSRSFVILGKGSL